MNQGPELECKIEKPEYDDNPITITDLDLEDLAELSKLVKKSEDVKKKGIFDFDSDSDNNFNYGDDDDDVFSSTYSIKSLTLAVNEHKKEFDLKLKSINDKLDTILNALELLNKKESQFTDL